MGGAKWLTDRKGGLPWPELWLQAEARHLLQGRVGGQRLRSSWASGGLWQWRQLCSAGEVMFSD